LIDWLRVIREALSCEEARYEKEIDIFLRLSSSSGLTDDAEEDSSEEERR
jgi:hypothetical protein